jgi:hypothetical protein
MSKDWCNRESEKILNFWDVGSKQAPACTALRGRAAWLASEKGGIHHHHCMQTQEQWHTDIAEPQQREGHVVNGHVDRWPAVAAVKKT